MSNGNNLNSLTKITFLQRGSSDVLTQTWCCVSVNDHLTAEGDPGWLGDHQTNLNIHILWACWFTLSSLHVHVNQLLQSLVPWHVAAGPWPCFLLRTPPSCTQACNLLHSNTPSQISLQQTEQQSLGEDGAMWAIKRHLTIITLVRVVATQQVWFWSHCKTLIISNSTSLLCGSV